MTSKIKISPLNNVQRNESSRNSWVALTNDPQFVIHGIWKITGSTVRISGKILTEDKSIPHPVIYMDTGNGLSEKESIPLHVSPSGEFSEELKFPIELKYLRFDPVSKIGKFSIIDFNIKEIKQTVSILSRLLMGMKLKKIKSVSPLSPPPKENYKNNYQLWLERYEAKPESFSQVKNILMTWQVRPCISIVMPTFNSPKEWLVKAIESVRAQTYSEWELCIADDCSTDSDVRTLLEKYAGIDSRIKIKFRSKNGHISAASNSALELATGDYIGLLDHDDELHPMALFCVARAIKDNPHATLLFTDEDKISVDGKRYDPYFKCDLNYDLLLSQNMICHFGVYKTSVMREIGGFRESFEGSQDYDLALRFLEYVNFNGVIHIPFVLYHWRAIPGSTADTTEAKPYALIAAMRAVQEHFDRQGIKAKVDRDALATDYNRVNYSIPSPAPSVELIIPTRDGADLIRVCVRSILEKTTYQNYIVTVIDNGSTDPDALDLFKEMEQDCRVRVVRDDSPFNYSAINNKVALKSGADIIGLLNNDMEVISSEWLDEMVSLSIQQGVGCVGAKLIYPDNTLQHAGVIIGVGGVAGHSHKKFPRNASGYFSRLRLRSSMSAVTAACLVIRTSIFRKVGGFDESLSVAFNDVDFCLRVGQAGYRNIWTPYAELFHHESASRGYEDTPEKQARFITEVQRMQERWGKQLQTDPCYSPNLTLEHEDFSYAWPPRVQML